MSASDWRIQSSHWGKFHGKTWTKTIKFSFFVFSPKAKRPSRNRYPLKWRKMFTIFVCWMRSRVAATVNSPFMGISMPSQKSQSVVNVSYLRSLHSLCFARNKFSSGHSRMVWMGRLRFFPLILFRGFRFFPSVHRRIVLDVGLNDLAMMRWAVVAQRWFPP